MTTLAEAAHDCQNSTIRLSRIELQPEYTEVTTARKPGESALISSATRGDLVADALRASILSGELAAGTQLVETRLAETFGVSRGPLREAIRTLADEGLVINKAYTGSYVTTFSERDLINALNIRTALECLAFKLCWPFRDDNFRRSLLARYEALEDASHTNVVAKQISAELEFHSIAFDFCNNELLQDNWKQLAQKIQLGFCIYRSMPMKSVKKEWHKNYLDLAQGDDLAAMIKEVEDHIRAGIASIRKYSMERNKDPRPPAGAEMEAGAS